MVRIKVGFKIKIRIKKMASLADFFSHRCARRLFSRHISPFCHLIGCTRMACSSIVDRQRGKMAGANDGNKTKIKQRFDDVCKELNMDEVTAVSAWETYEKIDRNYTLEVG